MRRLRSELEAERKETGEKQEQRDQDVRRNKRADNGDEEDSSVQGDVAEGCQRSSNIGLRDLADVDWIDNSYNTYLKTGEKSRDIKTQRGVTCKYDRPRDDWEDAAVQ